MRLLDRYLLRELLVPLGVCLAGFFVFSVAFDLLTQLESFHQRRMRPADVALYYWYELPDLLTTVLPVGFLLALLYALSLLARHQELTAMRAAGLSLWRICLPYWLVGVLFSGGLYALNEHWAGEARERQELLLGRDGVTDDGQGGPWRSLDFQNRTDRHSWSIGGFHMVTAELRSPRVRLPMGAGGRQEFEAASLRWTNGGWRARVVDDRPPVERVYRSAADADPVERPIPASGFPAPAFPPEDVAGWRHRVLWVPEWRPLWLTNEVDGTNVVILTNRLVEVRWHTNLVVPTPGPAGSAAWTVRAFLPETGELRGVRMTRALERDAQRLVMASEAEWSRGGWTFRNVQDFVYRHAADDDPLVAAMASRRMPELTETPAMLRSEARVGSLHRSRVLRKPQLTVREVRNYYHLHREVPGALRAWLDTQLHSRLAAPWTCVVVALIAVPFGAPGGRRNVFYGVAGSIALAFVYFVVQRFGFAMGQGGRLPPLLAAWLPNVVFGLLGLVLTARVR